jgi:ubiquinone/menaquinone biosynthesis C-methylase UbiE
MAIRSLIDFNVRLSRATERRLQLPTDKTLWRKFETEAQTLIKALPDDATVLDLGGGRRCVYAKSVQPPGRINLVAIDLSAAELALNTDVSEKHVADVAVGLPMPDASVDLILSRALLEHVADVPGAITHMARVLKRGGLTLHLIPCRYSIFGTAARILPFRPLLRLVHFVMPWTKGQVEFPVHYHNCYPQALERAFNSAGFSEVQLWLTWAQPGYLEAAYPLFLLHAGYEWLVRTLGLRRLAAYAVVRAVR